jgi:dihydrofolate synthase/folylpolyglutamate synthase
MTFAQAQSYVLELVNETASRREPYRLERMARFLQELGNPQDRYPTIHVGGTSGKGSTSVMIAAALSAAGKRTGLHTKPHLRTMLERARIDGEPVSQERFAELVGELIPAIDRIAAEFTRPSYYETLLALTFLYFAQEQVDAAVIEVGIGGKLDGTNVLHPRVSLITNVGLDHTEILGDTVEQIAADKAGIAKPGVPLVSAVDRPGARAVIEAQCAAVGAPFLFVPDLVKIEDAEAETHGQRFTLKTPREEYRIDLPLLGEFQQRNAACAVLALEQLPPELRPACDDVERGLARVELPGRMEYFPSHPAVVFDVAHNPDKAENLVRSLRALFPDKHFTFVIAIGESKDAAEIIRVFAQAPATFIFTQFDARGRPAARPQRLASIAESEGWWGRAVTDPVEALAIARRNASGDEVVVVTGSTFVVAELREWWMENVVASRAAH